MQELDGDGVAMVKKPATRSVKEENLVEGLDRDLVSSSKGWWNSFLNDGENLDGLEFGNKMVLLMDILKECALIGDKVWSDDFAFLNITTFFCRCWSSVSLCCPWT